MWSAISKRMKQEWSDLKPLNPIWLPAFRILGSLFVLAHFLAVFPDFNTFWGSEAMVLPDIQDAYADQYSPTLYDLHAWVNGYIPMGFDTLVRGIAFAYMTSLVLLAVGFLTRVTAFVALLLHLILVQSVVMFLYGADYMTSISLFYMLLFPVGRTYSMDAWLWKNREKQNDLDTRYFLLLFQGHWALAYFFSGIDKALGPTWWNGEAIWKALYSYNQTGLVDPELWKHTPWLLALVGIGTVLLETFYPLGVFFKKTRTPWIMGIILMHLSIGFLLGLYFFSGIMVLMNLVAFWFPYLAEKEKGIS